MPGRTRSPSSIRRLRKRSVPSGAPLKATRTEPMSFFSFASREESMIPSIPRGARSCTSTSRTHGSIRIASAICERSDRHAFDSRELRLERPRHREIDPLPFLLVGQRHGESEIDLGPVALERTRIPRRRAPRRRRGPRRASSGNPRGRSPLPARGSTERMLPSGSPCPFPRDRRPSPGLRTSVSSLRLSAAVFAGSVREPRLRAEVRERPPGEGERRIVLERRRGIEKQLAGSFTGTATATREKSSGAGTSPVSSSSRRNENERRLVSGRPKHRGEKHGAIERARVAGVVDSRGVARPARREARRARERP